MPHRTIEHSYGFNENNKNNVEVIPASTFLFHLLYNTSNENDSI